MKLTTQKVQEVIDDWWSGKYDHGDLINRHNLSRQQEFFITFCANHRPKMITADIRAKLNKVHKGMSGAQMAELTREGE